MFNPTCGCQVASAGGRAGQWGSARGLLEHEHVVWMGDLNYRLSLPDPEVRKALFTYLCNLCCGSCSQTWNC